MTPVIPKCARRTATSAAVAYSIAALIERGGQLHDYYAGRSIYGDWHGVSQLRMAEPPPDPLSESDLSTIWAGQQFPAEALSLPDGTTPRVINPGRLNHGPGPDFFDAVVEIGGEQRRGDVELHVRASAFRGHGHHLDSAYDRVALHVVYLADDGTETALSDGGRTPVAAFAPWLQRRTEDLQRWLDQPPLWQEPCRSAEFRLGRERIAAVLADAGRARFEAKVNAMQALICESGPEAALWWALIEAMGSGGDKAAFRELGQLVTPELVVPRIAGLPLVVGAMRLEDLLLHVAGLRCVEEGQGLPRLARPPASTGRPANRPERRLRAFASLYRRADGDLAGYALRTVVSGKKALLAAWQAPSVTGPALLGPERSQEVVLNVVLPFAAAAERGLRSVVDEVLDSLPASAPYGKTAFLEENLRRSDGRRAVRGVLEQQGLLGLLAQWCSQGGCGRCPLS